jgi:imidazolonepropionase
MKKLLKSPAKIVTVDTNGRNYRRGKDSSALSILYDHSIIIENKIIKDFIPNSKVGEHTFDKVIDLSGMIILPGLVECHTHTAFTGSRSNEFFMRLKGATYQEIAEAGGGIISTVKAVRQSSFEELVRIIKSKIDLFISQGVTTLEIKSGYGLSYYDEIKILQVINYFKQSLPINIIPTFLGAHTYPPEYKNDHKKYLKIIIDELLPFIIKNGLAEYVDAFCEKGAFSSEEVDKIFSKAKKLGYKLRLHTEQFNNVGGLDVALKHNALSVDHLEVITENDVNKLSGSDTVAVLLPGVSFFLNYQFAPARQLIDNNAIVALSTDFNPGSSNIPNLHLIMSIAALKMGMNAEEIISGVTINAAKALGISDKIGSIEIGKEADFAVFNLDNYEDIIYNTGQNLNIMTIKNGEIVYKQNMEN